MLVRFSSLLLLLTAIVVSQELVIETTKAVTCNRKSKKGDKVDVHYRGTLAADGSQFDASYDRGQPLNFELGAGRVIKGYVHTIQSDIKSPNTGKGEFKICWLTTVCYRWDDGLLDMCIGEKRKLTIPPELGYGQRAMGPIPAGSTLVFETELMGIAGVKKDEL